MAADGYDCILSKVSFQRDFLLLNDFVVCCVSVNDRLFFGNLEDFLGLLNTSLSFEVVYIRSGSSGYISCLYTFLIRFCSARVKMLARKKNIDAGSGLQNTCLTPLSKTFTINMVQPAKSVLVDKSLGIL